MKKLSLLFAAMLVLAACGEEEAAEPVEQEETVEETTDEPTQEELNAQMKEEAIEAEFTKANAEEYEVGTRLKATGEVSFMGDDQTFLEFTLTTEEGEGFGMYNITGVNTTETEIADGQVVTVYGAYDGKDEELGFPIISVTIVE